MSDKIEGTVKISVRIPRRILNIALKAENDGLFRSKSEFINEALNYFTGHLETLKTFGRKNLNRKFRPPKLTESKIHSKLKKLAWSVLCEMECKSIEFEMPILINGRRLIIDVYGIGPNNEKIAVECWVSSKGDEERFQLMQKYFDQIIVFTPYDLIEFYEDTLYYNQQLLKNLSNKFKAPLLNVQPTPETTVEFINNTERVGSAQLPYEAIKEELLKGNIALIKGLRGIRTLEKLHKRLRFELKSQIQGQFKVFSKYAIDSKGEPIWMIELRRKS